MACKPDTRRLTDILPYVLPYCTPLPQEMALDYGRRAYIDFARRTGALYKTLTMDLQEGIAEYPIEMPDGYKVSRVNWVNIDGGRCLIPAYTERSCHCRSSSYTFHVVGHSCVILHTLPVKDVANGLYIQISVQPTQDVCTFDDDFFDRWVEGIAYGALAKAMMLPNTDWFDKQSAMFYDQKFRVEVARARHKSNLNGSRGPMQMKAKRFV